MKANVTEGKRKKELEVVRTMIELFCYKCHKKEELCPKCRKLLDYSAKRINNCPFMEEKTFCSACKVHCYEKGMREKIKVVMRFSGPRMIFYYPIMTIGHAFQSLKQKVKN